MRHGKATASTTRTANAAAAPVPGAVSQCAVVTWMKLDHHDDDREDDVAAQRQQSDPAGGSIAGRSSVSTAGVRHAVRRCRRTSRHSARSIPLGSVLGRVGTGAAPAATSGTTGGAATNTTPMTAQTMKAQSDLRQRDVGVEGGDQRGEGEGGHDPGDDADHPVMRGAVGPRAEQGLVVGQQDQEDQRGRQQDPVERLDPVDDHVEVVAPQRA